MTTQVVLEAIDVASMLKSNFWPRSFASPPTTRPAIVRVTPIWPPARWKGSALKSSDTLYRQTLSLRLA